MSNKYYCASIRWILSVSLRTMFVSFPIIVRWNSEATSRQNCAYKSLRFADGEGIEERNREKATKFLRKLANLRELVSIGHVCSKDLSDLLLCGDWNARWSFPFGPRWPRPFVATRKMDNSVRLSFSLPISLSTFTLCHFCSQIWNCLVSFGKCQAMSATNHANTYRRRRDKLTSRRNEDEEASALIERDCIFVPVPNVHPIRSDVSFA